MAQIGLTKAQLRKYFTDDTRRRALQREVEDLTDKHSAEKAEIIDFVLKNGGPDRTIVQHGYVLAVTHQTGQPKWKDEFLAVAGEKKAEELRQKANPVNVLSVRRVAT